jgi:ADP-heptose:LPS heptosyltransferase
MFSKLKTLIRFSICIFFDLFVIPSKIIKPKSLLLIRLDAIGDYVIFRNFIEVLKTNEKYKDHKITLLGNSAWKYLSEELDGDYIAEFIWLHRSEFYQDVSYRYKKLKEISSHGYDVILSPVYSREFLFADAIVKLVTANEKIGSVGDFSNITKKQKNISDNYYTKLINASNELMFEFNRNKEFFENYLHVEPVIQKIKINPLKNKLSIEMPDRYAVLFIGASKAYRKWNIESFASVARHLKKAYGYDIVLCGGPAEIEDASIFCQSFNSEYLDLVGKTSLLDLLSIIHKGDIMIANETSAPHLAVALETTKVFVISNGNHYGRFTPYPKEITKNYHAIFHPQIANNLDDHKKLSNQYGFGSELNISDISVEQVIKSIDSLI